MAVYRHDRHMFDHAGIGDLIDGLDTDPMLAMSQGSKELFHSDLLAWYVGRFPAVRTALLDAWAPAPGPVTDNGGIPVRREWRHLDLVVHVPERQPLVVENKMFSLPDERQLDRYATTVAAHLPGEPSLVLLSLTEPGWPEGRWVSPQGRAPWTYRSYQELMEILRQVRPEVYRTDDGFAGRVLDRWLNMLARLHALVEAVGCPGPEEPLDLDADTCRELQRLRLDAPVQKMRYQAVATHVRRQLATELPGIDISAGLSNGKGLVQGSIDGPRPRLGWQLQQQQFRLALVVADHSPGHGRNEVAREARYAQAREHDAFFDFSAVRELISSAGPERPLNVEGRPIGFLRFDPNFTYRYVPVPGITVGQAIELGIRYTRRAARQHPQ